MRLTKAQKAAALAAASETSTAIVTLPPVTDAEAEQAATVAAERAERITGAEKAAQRAAESARLRAIACATYAAYNAAVSVPVKPAATFKAYRATLGALRCDKPSARQAAALTVAALAAGINLRDIAADATVNIPRRFNLGADAYVIENGCAADCVSVGLATYTEAAEAFTVSAKQAAQIAALLGAARLSIPLPVAA